MCSASCAAPHTPPPPFTTPAAPAKLATPYRIAAARCPMTEPIDYAKLDSAIGLNWYELDPNLRSLMDQYLSPQAGGWAEERLQRWGEICGGPIAANAEVIDRNPPQLEQYDAWGNESPRVPYPPSQSATGMVCSTGMTGGVMSLVDRYAPPGVREELMAHLLAPSFDDGWDGAMFMTELRGGSDLATTETTAPRPGGGGARSAARRPKGFPPPGRRRGAPPPPRRGGGRPRPARPRPLPRP